MHKANTMLGVSRIAFHRMCIDPRLALIWSKYAYFLNTNVGTSLICSLYLGSMVFLLFWHQTKQISKFCCLFFLPCWVLEHIYVLSPLSYPCSSLLPSTISPSLWLFSFFISFYPSFFLTPFLSPTSLQDSWRDWHFSRSRGGICTQHQPTLGKEKVGVVSQTESCMFVSVGVNVSVICVSTSDATLDPHPGSASARLQPSHEQFSLPQSNCSGE